MPRKCSICQHEQREAIDQKLIAGESFRDIAKRFVGVSISALHRHKNKCLTETISDLDTSQKLVVSENVIAATDSVLDQVRQLQDQALAILAAAGSAGNLRTALAAIREARANIELLARLTEKLAATTEDARMPHLSADVMHAIFARAKKELVDWEADQVLIQHIENSPSVLIPPQSSPMEDMKELFQAMGQRERAVRERNEQTGRD